MNLSMSIWDFCFCFASYQGAFVIQKYRSIGIGCLGDSKFN